ncbi:MAG: hypothetical protein ACRD4T_10240 [Candidatus Acidiferrales bacterium]
MSTEKRSLLVLSLVIGTVLSVATYALQLVRVPYLEYLSMPGVLFSAYLGFFLVGMAHGGFPWMWADFLAVVSFNSVIYSVLIYCILRIARRIAPSATNSMTQVAWPIQRILGVYLVGVSAYQVLLYGWSENVFTMVEPRWSAVFMLEETASVSYDLPLAAIRWASAIWLSILGYLFLRGRSPVWPYIVSEGLLAVPTIAFFAVFGVTAHVLIPDALFAFLLFTLIPVSLALLHLKGRRQKREG